MKITLRRDYLTLVIISSLVIALLAALLLFHKLFSRSTPGSFEFIRRGEALMDKGRYDEGLKQYERALEASPESEDIRRNLVYAYSKYAMKLMEEDKYSAGIGYLTKAHDVLQNAYTRQNLALAYANKSIMEAARSDLAAAKMDIDRAHEVIGDSVSGNRNLSVTLFNGSVDEFKAGRNAGAVLLAKEAVSGYADARIYEFLSDIHYKDGDLVKAKHYLEKAYQTGAADVKLSEKLEKIKKEELLVASEKTEKFAGFELRFDRTLPVDAALVSSILYNAYRDVGGDLDYMPKSRIAVYLYSEKDFRDIFKLREMVRAFYDGNIRMPLPATNAEEKELASYLYHEYAHAVISAKTNNNCPVWLSEGIAVYEEVRWTRPGAAIRIDESLLKGQEISLGALETTFNDPASDPVRLTLAYILADTAVQFMVETGGMKKFNGVLDKISDGQHAVNAIDDVYLLSEADFNKKWSEFIMERYVKK